MTAHTDDLATEITEHLSSKCIGHESYCLRCDGPWPCLVRRLADHRDRLRAALEGVALRISSVDRAPCWCPSEVRKLRHLPECERARAALAPSADPDARPAAPRAPRVSPNDEPLPDPCYCGLPRSECRAPFPGYPHRAEDNDLYGPVPSAEPDAGGEPGPIPPLASYPITLKITEVRAGEPGVFPEDAEPAEVREQD
jgi:hypothetical protein